MKKSVFFAAASAALLAGLSADAQTNVQLFWDAGRGYATTTFEMFKGDKWGNTFFFIDHYYSTKDNYDQGAAGNQNGTYYEIERCFNFWQGTPLSDLSLELEYDGGNYGSSVFCVGLNYFLHSKDFKNTFNLALLYTKNYGYDSASEAAPVKFSGVWGMQDLFGVKGLRFSGFVDVWGIDRSWVEDGSLNILGPLFEKSSTSWSLLTEPQVWYNVGQFMGCDNLNVGGEVEISCNFSGARKGWAVNPALGVKWIF